jgi:hypothetical protein
LWCSLKSKSLFTGDKVTDAPGLIHKMANTISPLLADTLTAARNTLQTTRENLKKRMAMIMIEKKASLRRVLTMAGY